jgi:hypothetical protein
MKGIGWIVIMMALLGVGYLVVRDLGVLRGEQAGEVVIDSLERTRDTVSLVEKTQNSLQKALDKIDE